MLVARKQKFALWTDTTKNIGFLILKNKQCQNRKYFNNKYVKYAKLTLAK